MINVHYLKNLKTNILYVFPLAKGVDGILLYENVVFIIQIKCSKRADYVEKGLTTVLQVVKRLQRSKFTIVPWLIDVLGGLNPKKIENNNILYTTKTHLVKFLPERLK